MSIRVLHVLDKISVDSGVSAVVMNYYSGLDHERVTFDFMLNEEPDPAARACIESKGSKIFIMPELRPANTLKYIKALKQFYKTSEHKIIHGHVANSAFLYLRLAKNIPHRIIHSHNSKSSDKFWKRIRNWILTRRIKSSTNLYFACSKEAADFLFRKNTNRIIVNNAVDTDRFLFNQQKRDEIRAELGLSEEMLIGHAGRFCQQKNQSFLVDVFSEVYRKNKDARLILIGGGELELQIRRKVEKAGLNGVVFFPGLTNDIAGYMSAMDVFALPSLFEGLPLTAVEAQASGLPVLLSDRISKETNITGEARFLPLDVRYWADSILKTTAKDRCDAGKSVKHSRFDIETQVERLCKYYEDIIKQ